MKTINRYSNQLFNVILGITVVALLFVGSAYAQTTEIVSVSSTGQEGNSHSQWSSISPDGRFVAFQSRASNLVDGDSNGVTDVFLRDLVTGQTERVSVSSSGQQGDNHSFLSDTNVLSADGRFVAFRSLASNLLPGGNPLNQELYVYDRLTAQINRIPGSLSLSSLSLRYSISGDGRYVVFTSSDDTLVPGDTNMKEDVFVYDQTTAQIERVSISSSGEQGNNISYDPYISGDGQTIAFISVASNLVTGDTNGAQDVFVHDRLTGQTKRMSVSSGGEEANSFSFAPRISNDGLVVSFTSFATNLVAGDTNARDDIFLHDRVTGQTERVSVSSTGVEANADSLTSFISGNGQFVAFSSLASNLVAEDTNGLANIFLYDRVSGHTELQSIGIAGVSGGDSPTLSNNARFVVFQSRGHFVIGQNNNVVNVFIRDREAITLSLSKAGSGAGTITSSPAGIFCETDCSEVYDRGTEVTLTAVPDAGSTFNGWIGGGCSEFTPCVFTLDTNTTIVATFTSDTHTLTIMTAGTGSGAVTGSGTYNFGDTASVSATASGGSTFTGWSGNCSGTTSSSSVLMNADKVCTATFTLNTHTLAVNTDGSGSGTTSGAGTYNFGDTASVSATASGGSTFTGWSGNCSGTTSSSSVLMNADKVCTATFDLLDAVGPVASNVVINPNPAAVNTGLILGAGVDDSTTFSSNIASAEYNIDGGPYIAMTPVDGGFNSVFEGATVLVPAFASAGVHSVCVRGTDAAGNVGEGECIFLAVFDPDGGFVSGGGWINSPVNACNLTPGCESEAGKANFGFVSKYKNGANVPTGETEFQFKAGNLDFHSSVYEWLVVAGARAQFKGSGTINGGGDYGFMLTTIDGQVSGGGGNDKFRIKIWDKNNGDGIVYDNQVGGNTGDDAEPTTTIGGGSIIIHK